MYILGIITEIFKAGTFRCRKRHPTPAPRTRSTASADMNKPFCAKSARSCLRLMPWIAANHKIEGAVSGSAADKNCRPTSAMSVDFQRADRGIARPDWHFIGNSRLLRNWLRFVNVSTKHF